MRMSDGCDYATLGGAVQLGQNQSGYTQCRIESLELTERVSARCGIQHQQDSCGAAGDVGVSGNALAMTRFTFLFLPSGVSV